VGQALRFARIALAHSGTSDWKHVSEDISNRNGGKSKFPIFAVLTNDVEKWARAAASADHGLKELAIDEVRYQLWKDGLKSTGPAENSGASRLIRFATWRGHAPGDWEFKFTPAGAL
jgi:hypothetical protein